MLDSAGLIVFQGQGPFSLPVAQSATASGGSNGVEITLYCLLPGRERTQAIRAPMRLSVAKHLAESLAAALIDSELADKRT